MDAIVLPVSTCHMEFEVQELRIRAKVKQPPRAHRFVTYRTAKSAFSRLSRRKDNYFLLVVLGDGAYLAWWQAICNQAVTKRNIGC